MTTPPQHARNATDFCMRVQLQQLERLAEADAGADEGDEPEAGADLVATHNCVARLLRRTPCGVGLRERRALPAKKTAEV